MYTASVLASLSHFIKDTCETEYTDHKRVKRLKALWTATNTDDLRGKFQRMCKVPLGNTTACDNTVIYHMQRKTRPLLDGA